MGLLTTGIRTATVTLALSICLVAGVSARSGAPHGPAASPVSRDSAVAAHTAAVPRIRGTVGPSMTISVNPSRAVKGRYRIVVNDESSAHNWHITGPGDVDKETSVSGTGKWVWRVRLRRGTYTIVCDPHASSMNTSLRVTAD